MRRRLLEMYAYLMRNKWRTKMRRPYKFDCIEEKSEFYKYIKEHALQEKKMKLTNIELADAITAAHNRAGDSTSTQKIWMEHLKMLLKVQDMRAAFSEESSRKYIAQTKIGVVNE